jgi:twitching motility protein PilT
VSFFPSEEQFNVRTRLAENLQAIVSLRLLPTKKQTGRVPAVEILRTTRSIRECIKDPAKAAEINEYISRGESMQTFDQHLLDLVKASKISVDTALTAASNPADFKTKLALEGADPEAADDEERTMGPMELESDERF